MVWKGKFDKNNILSDEVFLNYEDKFVIQDFLEDRKSWLAYNKVCGRFLWEIIEEYCLINKTINPKIILTKMQVEQSLISSKEEPMPYQLNWCLGYGKTDNEGDKLRFAGLENQVFFATKRLLNLFYLEKSRIGIEREVLDGIVKPDTSATGVLYTYTPWIGDRAVELKSRILTPPFGNYLFWMVWKGYFGD